MKTITYQERGHPAEVLQVVTKPSPTLSAGEVRVQMQAAPIHPSDLLQISGHYGVKPPLPSTPGTEGAGRVVEVGPGVEHLAVGQTVLVVEGGTWRDEVTGPAARFIPLPEGGDIEQLSMLGVNPMTAFLMLSRFVDLKPGDWIVQSAANSAVGTFIIQLAAQRGVKTVNVVRRKDLTDELTALGADIVLTDGPDLAERVRASTDNAPIPLAIDCVGGETFSRLVECLAYGATVVAYGSLSMQPPALNSAAIIFNDVRVRGFWLSKWFETANPEDKKMALGQLIQQVAQGSLKTKIDERFGLDDIQAAVKRAADSGRNGKVILRPNPA